ncbi:hypothetical protein FRC10_010959 [Ceratobasidium sp. 414]|nr:hypothetical protein FRC10_010959 [Ceratobasidium sp. 414]
MLPRIHPRMDMPGMGSSGSSNQTDSSFPHMCSRKVGFAFSIISIFLMAFLIEGTRRAARNYDRMLSAKHATSNKGTGGGSLRPTLKEQLVRGAFYGVQFSAAYILMLIAMSFK